MATSYLTLTLTTDHAVAVQPGGGTATVAVTSGSSVYYGSDPQVSATQNNGSIVLGTPVAFTSPVWIRSAGPLSNVTVAFDSGGGITPAQLPPSAVLDSSANPGSAVVASSPPRNQALRDCWTPYDFNCSGNGTTDDTANLQAWIAACQTGGRIAKMVSGTFLCSASLTNTANKQPLVVKGEDPATCIFAQAAGITGPVINTIGSIVSNLTISNPVAAGANVITGLSSTAGMVPGTVLMLRDTSQTATWTGAARTQAGVVGEFARVYTVDSASQVTLHQNLDYAYTTAADIRYFVTGPPAGAQQVHVEGVGFRNNFPNTQSINAKGIAVNYCIGLSVDHCDFFGLDTAGIGTAWTLDFNLSNLRFQDLSELAASGGAESGLATYGVSVGDACSQGLVEHLRSRYGRHVITGSGGSATEFGSTYVKVGDCIATEHAATGFDTHPGARWYTFENCQVHGSFPTGGSAGVHGFQVRGPDTTFIKCRVRNLPATAGGRTAYGFNVVAGSDRCRILGGEVDTADYGVFVTDSDDCFIGDDLRLSNLNTQAISITRDAAYSSFMNSVGLGAIQMTNVPATPIANAGNVPINYLP
jgi:hypothetical protein